MSEALPPSDEGRDATRTAPATEITPLATPTQEAWEGLAFLTRGTNDPILLVDAKGTILAATRGAGRWRREELVDRSILELATADRPELLAAAIGDAVSPRLTHRLDLRIAKGQDQVAWYQAIISPIPAEAETAAALVRLQDVSARRKEEARLRRSERLMMDTQDVAHLGTWEWDISEPHATWSEELYHIYGLDPGHHTPTYQDYLTRVHPDDRARVKAATERVFTELEPYSHDERIIRTDGEIRYLHTWAQPVLDEQGNLVRLLGVCQDITDRKRTEAALEASEARFRAIFDDAGSGILQLSPKGQLLTMNPAFTELLDRPAEALEGLAFSELIHPEDLEHHAEEIEAFFTDGSGSAHLELRLLDRDLRPVWTRTVLSWVHPGEDLAPFPVAMVEDVTAQKTAEAALTEQAEELARSNEELERFTYITSHDLKEPLRMVASYVQLLSRRYEGNLDEQADQYIAYAVEGVQRMNSLLDDLLAYSRADAQPPPMEPVDLEEVLDATLARLASPIEANAAQVTTGSLPTVRGNQSQLVHLFQNLIGNALKFKGQDPPAVEVRAEGEEGVWHIQVIDNGIGVEPEHRERIFEIFKRLNPRERYPGTGVGLAICRKIAERHGGELWVTDRPDGRPGAAFHLTLPASPA